MSPVEFHDRRITMRLFVTAASLLLSAAAALAGPVEEQNKRIVSVIFTDIFGKWHIAENEHIYSPDYVGHAGDQHFTRAEDRAAVEGWKTFAPEGKMTILQIIAEGDLVAVLWTGEGINTGEGNGLPATGRPFRATAMTMFRLKEGKIVEEWNVFDNYSFLSQLGLLPKPGG
jgi:predicted ester cyclase